jgi:hypothetical protein
MKRKSINKTIDKNPFMDEMEIKSPYWIADRDRQSISQVTARLDFFARGAGCEIHAPRFLRPHHGRRNAAECLAMLFHPLGNNKISILKDVSNLCLIRLFAREGQCLFVIYT